MKIKTLLYSMKKRGTKQVTLKNILNTDNADFTTGEITTSEITRIIKKAIVIPEDISYTKLINVNSNKYGGDFHKGFITVIILTKDLGNFSLTENTQVIFDNQKYEIKVLSNYDDAYILAVYRVVGDTNV